MRAMLAVAVIISGLLFGIAEVRIRGVGTSHGADRGREASYSNDRKTTAPEAWTLYVLASGLALLGGAGWYIRRRK